VRHSAVMGAILGPYCNSNYYYYCVLRQNRVPEGFAES
jgi:hypothetical protein